MNPRPLQQIDNSPPAPASGTFAQRVEHKYWLPAAELKRTIGLIQSFIPVYHYTPAGWASVRTVCLDTPDLRCYRDYLDGLCVRWKVRMRQYGDEGRFGDKCWVEIKMKNRGIGSKRRFACSLFDLYQLVDNGTAPQGHIETQGMSAGQIALWISQLIRKKQLKPKVRIDYERLSFQHSEQDAIRITLDRNLHFMSADAARTGHMQGLVLELKYNGLTPPWFDELANKISLHRAHRLSKYARAVGALDGVSLSGALS